MNSNGGSNALYGGGAFNTFLLGNVDDDGVNQVWGGASQMAGVTGFANNTISFAEMAVGRSVYVDLLNGHNAYVNDGANNDGIFTLEASIVNVPNVIGSSGGDVIIAQQAQPPTLDAMTTTAQAARNISLHMFESLYTRDEGANPQPDLAEGVNIAADGMTYTFKLRTGVKFHNGNAVTADDVVWNWN
eukprot:gene15800-20186_t